MSNITLTGESLENAWTEVWQRQRDHVDQAILRDEDVPINLTWLSKHMQALEATFDDTPQACHEAAIHTLKERIENPTRIPWPVINQDWEQRHTSVEDIGSQWVHKLIRVRGTIRSIGPKETYPLIQTLRCLKCQHRLTTRQSLKTWEDNHPYQCPQCDKKAKWVTDRQDWLVNVRLARIAAPTGTTKGINEHRLMVLPGPLADMARPGQDVDVSAYPVLKGDKPPYQLVLIATNVDPVEKQDDDGANHLDAYKQLLETSENPVDMVADAIMPHHHGNRDAKRSLALSLFTKKTGTYSRETIHVLMVGDPGTGKSQLLRSIDKHVANTVKANAARATKAGYTGTTVPDDELGGTRLEPGLLPMADQGYCLIDEFDDGDTDKGKLNEAMSQQTVSMALAGNAVTLPARCSVLAGANPEHRDWDYNQPPADQITLDPTVISRFDAIHLFARPKEEDTIRTVIRKQREREHPEPEKARVVASVADYLCRNHDVVLTDVATEYLEDAHVATFKEYDGDGVPIGQRHYDSMERFAIAHARLHLRREAGLEDAEFAAGHVHGWIENIAKNRFGEVDVSKLTSPEAYSQKDRVRMVLAFIREEEPLLSELVAGLPWGSGVVEETVGMLKERGEVFQPDGARFKVVE